MLYDQLALKTAATLCVCVNNCYYSQTRLRSFWRLHSISKMNIIKYSKNRENTQTEIYAKDKSKNNEDRFIHCTCSFTENSYLQHYIIQMTPNNMGQWYPLPFHTTCKLYMGIHSLNSEKMWKTVTAMLIFSMAIPNAQDQKPDFIDNFIRAGSD